MAIIVESFEGIAPGPNASLFYAGAIRIGTTGIYEFASGANLVVHIPNTLTGPALIFDFDQGWSGGATVGYGPVNASTVPTGSAMFYTNLGNPAFDFDVPV
jgi:hypothetical protein